jgi:NitT/TauT family transport system permease protein
VLPAVGLLGFILCWWGATVWLTPPTGFLARFAPDKAALALVQLIGSGQLWPHLIASLRRVIIGLAISTAIGLPLGLAIGTSWLTARLSSALFQFIRMVSPLAWTPLAIICFGVGDGAVYFLIAIGGVWPIVLNSSAAVAALDPRWLTVGRSLRANRWELLATIIWPGIRPGVLTGLRLAVGLAWIILVPAEMLGVDSGLGYFILDTRDRLAYSDLMASIVVIGLCGFVLDSVARWLFAERRLRRRRTSERPVAAERRATGQDAPSAAGD